MATMQRSNSYEDINNLNELISKVMLGWVMQVIYLIVGNKIMQAEARLVGKVAEIQTPHGIIERRTWYSDRVAAENVLSKKRGKK